MKLRTWEVILALLCIAASITSLVLLEARPGEMSDQTAFWMFVLFIGFLCLPVGIILGSRIGRVVGQIVGNRGR
ncbi:hypothetical protein BWI15_00380 [Kribbella sp. ALI-6-A]|nr:hypothetical protein BWI15_00380 [Kribbella sp. ALI-6-A]